MGPTEGVGTGWPKSVTARSAKRAEYLFLFAHLLHMTPRDVDALTVWEFDQLVAQIDAYLREQQRANKKMEAV